MAEKTNYWFYGGWDIFLCILFDLIGIAFAIHLAYKEMIWGAVAIAVSLWLVQYIILGFLNRGCFLGNICLAMIRLLVPLLIGVAAVISIALLYAGFTESKDRKRNMAAGAVSGGIAFGVWQWLRLQCKDSE